MGDFIKDLKSDILDAMPDVNKLWAEYNAIVTLATVLPNARVIEKTSPLSLNLLIMIIGAPGIKKSLPMSKFTYPILKEAGETVDIDFLLPSRSSVEGFIRYVANNEHQGVGIIIRDEFSGMFKQLRKADWQSDGMEFLSEMYDGTFQKRVTTSHGLHYIEELYANLITATTQYFLSKLDHYFFIQGTGNRFLYCYSDPEEYEPEELDSTEYFREDWGDIRHKIINKYANKLANIYRLNITKIYVGRNVGDIWVEYKSKCEKEWKQRLIEDPQGWDYHPVKRYPELALKLAGIYAVSRDMDRLISLKSVNSVIINASDMKNSIKLMGMNRENFRNIVELKNKSIPQSKPYSMEDEVRTIITVLDDTNLITSSQWYDLQIITANLNKFNKLKKTSVLKGWVDEILWRDLLGDQKQKMIKMVGINQSSKFYRLRKK